MRGTPAAGLPPPPPTHFDGANDIHGWVEESHSLSNWAHDPQP